MDASVAPTSASLDQPPAMHERAVGLVEYLLAVRALVDKPVRTLPTSDVFWQRDLPVHWEVQVGPTDDTGPWLTVGRPPTPMDPVIPAGLIADLVWDLSYHTPPHLARPRGSAPPATNPEFDTWLRTVWQPWALLASQTETTRRLHDRLYDLRYRLDNDASRVELVWGHAILHATAGGQTIRYPLIATPVAIEYDADATAIRVSPRGPTRLQPDALSDLDNRRVADLLELGGPGGQVTVDPWDRDQRYEFAQRAMRRLGFDATVQDGPADAPAYIEDTGVLFVRPRQRMVRRFLEQMRARLDQPDPSVGALASLLAHEPSRLRMADDDPRIWQAVGHQLLMPMPTNQAQESIARRLAEHRSVAVQGPPGTGKTHTIRNLICHLVAHGKRVLVLAQKEDPLAVLRDGLPEALQPLCLAILGRSADQLVQLQTAARELSDRAATLDQRQEARSVQRLRDDLDRAHIELDQAQTDLADAAKRDSATVDFGDGLRTAVEVGQWLRDGEAGLAFIPDEIAWDRPAPMTAAQFDALAALCAQVPVDEREAAAVEPPPGGHLPTGQHLAEHHRSRREAGIIVDGLVSRGISAGAVVAMGQPAVAELAQALRAAATDLAKREGSWTDRLGQLVRDPSWQPVWDAHVTACQQLLAELTRRTTALAGRRVHVPADEATQARQLAAQLSQARHRLAAGRKVGRLGHGDLHGLMQRCRVDGESLRTLEDVELALASVERGQLRQQLITRWAEWAQRLDFTLFAAAFPAADPTAEPEVWAGRLLAEAVEATDWDRRRWPQLYQRLTEVWPGIGRDVDGRTIGEVAAALEAADAIAEVEQIAAEQAAIQTWLDQVAGAAPALAELTTAWKAADYAAWDQARAELQQVWAKRDAAQELDALLRQLQPVAPQWTMAIRRGELIPADGRHALDAWRWRQAQTWFDQNVGGVDTDVLGRRIEGCRGRIRQITSELVVTSAWLEVSRSLDDRKRAALADWTAALRKIGKGTGKSAAHWRAVAQQAMAEAVSAVPVWVMSIDRALEQFEGGQPLFDTVIVDEASQADIFALPVLSLARRAVVVGDDQQIGPQLVGLPADRVQGLIRTHLAGVPSAAHFDPDSSLYDHAVRRSPERILLTEHFRCVPSIIAFSSDTYYDGKIQPLRADLPTGLGSALNAVFIADGRRTQQRDFGEVNQPEAEALVSRVAQIVVDPAYTGKSIGVVSLLSTSGQAGYLHHRLREEIGPEELEHRRLRVGDPYTFQGDERDIILISMVVAPGSPIGAFTKRDFHRRVNVAASRARDQLWVFHSVTTANLTADDARALLLVACRHPRSSDTPADAGESACTNDFERAVLRAMLDQGLAPIPQYRIGTYRIDFVLSAPGGRRLAVECDTQRYHSAEDFADDLRRQAVLERVGNASFVRLRASLFARDPQRALAPLWQRATELEIA